MGRYLKKQLQRETKRGRTDRVAELLDRGANIDALARDGFTPLSRASYSGHLDAVQLLLDRGADPNLGAADGANPLFWATVKGHEEIVRLLLAHDADSNVARRGEGHSYSALHAAISGRQSAIAKMLIEAGASVDHEYLYRDALTHAEEIGLDEIVALLKASKRSGGVA